MTPGCRKLDERSILFSSFIGLSLIFDNSRGWLISSVSDLFACIARDSVIQRKITQAANRQANAWLGSCAKPVDLTAPEFQPGGIRSIDEDLPLCPYCRALREELFFSDELMAEAAE